uniref:Uncharacterized protein n=1 Tax=Timema monikensis TaxID=170555 RepID=A0A7R9HMC0_9NEOP|nr:unnamed protein product [Timema monikensis]
MPKNDSNQENITLNSNRDDQKKLPIEYTFLQQRDHEQSLCTYERFRTERDLPVSMRLCFTKFSSDKIFNRINKFHNARSLDKECFTLFENYPYYRNPPEHSNYTETSITYILLQQPILKCSHFPNKNEQELASVVFITKSTQVKTSQEELQLKKFKYHIFIYNLSSVKIFPTIRLTYYQDISYNLKNQQRIILKIKVQQTIRWNTLYITSLLFSTKGKGGRGHTSPHVISEGDLWGGRGGQGKKTTLCTSITNLSHQTLKKKLHGLSPDHVISTERLPLLTTIVLYIGYLLYLKIKKIENVKKEWGGGERIIFKYKNRGFIFIPMT